MDKDLEIFSDPCFGVTFYEESYASKFNLQRMTKKVNSGHLSVPMKDKIARIKSDATQGVQCLKQKDAWICFGHWSKWKEMYILFPSTLLYTLLLLPKYLFTGTCSITITRIENLEVGIFK